MTPWTIACQAPLSLAFPRQENWNGLPFPSPRDHSDPGIEPASPMLQVDSLPLSYIGLCCVSCSVVFGSLQPHGLRHARLPCPSPSPGVCSNSCPLSWWCHPTISSSVVPFSALQSFPASESFPISSLVTSGGKSIGHLEL